MISDRDIRRKAVLSVEKALGLYSLMTCPNCGEPDIYSYTTYEKTGRIYESKDKLHVKEEDLFGFEYVDAVYRCDDCGWED